MLASLVLAIGLAASSGDSLVVPAGTLVPVRFLSPIRSGSTRRGWTVDAETMADVVAGRCVAIPAYTQILGLVDESMAGWFFHRRGRLHLTFEAVHTAPGTWAPLTAVVEDLEWLPANQVDSAGVIRPAQHSLGHRLLGAGAGAGIKQAVLSPLLGFVAAPFGLASSAVGLMARGPRVEVREGDEATLRLTSALRLPANSCRPARPLPDSVPVSGLDRLPARTTGGNGEPGDVVNLLLLGSREDLERAFARALWVAAGRGGLRSRIGAATAVVFGKSDAHGPVSSQWLFDRIEDLGFERQGPNARERHHVRIWAADSAQTIWLGAANEDVGVFLTVVKPRITHRIASLVDAEREVLSRELEAGGCVVRLGFVRIPGSPFGGRNSSGEEFVTDGRAAVVRVGRCRLLSSGPASSAWRPRRGTDAPPP